MRRNAKRVKRTRRKKIGILLAVLLIVLAAAAFALHQTLKPPEIPTKEDEQGETAGEHRKDVYTVLVMGTDAEKANTDTILLASLHTEENKLYVMSIPRDTMINAPWDIKRINSVYVREGIEGMQKYIGELVGFVPDFHVVVDLSAFVELVDIIGGVEFNVPQRMYYSDPTQDLYIDLYAGEQRLDGESAMELVRFRRYVDGDIGRIRVQQDFMKALMEQCLQISNWTKISEYIKLFDKYVESNLSLNEMLGLGRQMMGMQMSDVEFFTMPGDYNASAWSRSYHAMQSYVIPNAEELLLLVNEKLSPYEEPITLEQLCVMSINADGSLSCTGAEVADTKAVARVEATPKKENKETEPQEPDEPSVTEPQEPSEPPTEEPSDGDEPSDYGLRIE